MMTVIETDKTIEVRSRVSGGMRVLCLLIALIPLLAPYELLIRIRWSSYLNPYFFFAAFIAAGAAAVSLFFVWFAIAAMNTIFRFERPQNRLIAIREAPVFGIKTRHFTLQDVREVETVRTDWTEGAPSYSLQILLADGTRLRSGPHGSGEEVRDIAARIRLFLDRK